MGGSTPPPHPAWRCLWRLPIPPKVKHFLWRVGNGRLPTKSALGSRGVQVAQECLFVAIILRTPRIYCYDAHMHGRVGACQQLPPQQDSKNRPSPVRLGQFVIDSGLTELLPLPDTGLGLVSYLVTVSTQLVPSRTRLGRFFEPC